MQAQDKLKQKIILVIVYYCNYQNLLQAKISRTELLKGSFLLLAVATLAHMLSQEGRFRCLGTILILQLRASIIMFWQGQRHC